MTTDFKKRHDTAWARVQISPSKLKAENALAAMIKGFVLYAEAYPEMFDGSRLSGDEVLDPEWEQIGHSLIGLLSGERGGLDGGTCWRLIAKALEDAGFNSEEQGKLREEQSNQN